MPEIFSKNTLWKRGGRLNKKRHVDLTEDEKAHVAKCTGTKNEHICKNPIFRCTHCGNYGCDQEIVDKCSEQGFKNNKCLHCGTVDSLVPVMEDELFGFMAEWDKEVGLVKYE